MGNATDELTISRWLLLAALALCALAAVVVGVAGWAFDREAGYIAAIALLGGLLGGAVWDVRALHRSSMEAWMRADSAEAMVRFTAAERDRAIGRAAALQARLQELGETASAVAILSQLDALYSAPSDPPRESAT